jgi:hypothetical protein
VWKTFVPFRFFCVVFHVEHSVADCSEKIAGLGVGDRDRGLEGEVWRRGGWGAGQEKQLVGGARGCGGYGGGHVVYSAECDGVEVAGFGHGFGAGGPNFDREAEGADGFAEERGLFVLGFGQGNGNFGVQKGYGDAGKTCPAAEVEEGGGCQAKVTGGEEAFAEVATDYFFGVADGGEVGAGVPFEEEIEIGGELGEETRIEISVRIWAAGDELLRFR